MWPQPVAYLEGGMVRCPPLGRPWKFFTGYFIWKGAFFAVFQQISEKNGRICSFHWTFKSKKCFSFRGAKPPWLPDQGLCPWTPLGAPPPDPRYRLELSALAMAPPLPNPKYATDSNHMLGCRRLPALSVHIWEIMSQKSSIDMLCIKQVLIAIDENHFWRLYPIIAKSISPRAISFYTVFHKKRPLFVFFHNSLRWWSIYTKFLLVVVKEILIQNILTNCNSWLNICC